MPNSNSKNNPIVITDVDGKKRTIQIVTLIGSNGEIIDFTDNAIDVNITSNGHNVGVQYPFPTNGDSIYCKDIWIEKSIVTDWIDEDNTGIDIACIPFTNLSSRITNTTINNPKELLIHFNRTIYATQVGLGCDNPLQSFSNVRITAFGSGGVSRLVQDYSLDDTKRNSFNYIFKRQELFNAIKIEFLTEDPISLSNITIQKVNEVSLPQVESTTNSLRIINYSHAELHQGMHYMTRSYFNLAKNGIKDFLIITPDSKRWGHLLGGFSTTSAPIVSEVFEGATYSSVGIELNSINRNRNFPNNNQTIIYEDPVIINEGISLGDGYAGSGKGVAGTERDTEELVLKQNTSYLVRITEQNVAPTIVGYLIDWYEHTNISEPE
jgi:hypothetical protein